MQVEFCGEWFGVEEDDTFQIGREGNLEIDDNPYLHRRFLTISHHDDLWWLENVGSRLSATVSDSDGNMQAWLAPGARLPLVFAHTTVLFTAGPTTYELGIVGDSPAFESSTPERTQVGETTIGPVTLTDSQKLLIIALAEPVLRGRGSTASIPTSAQAAARLGWVITRFNRKLDNVCEKLSRHGVRGLRGGQQQLAVNRRARLVEHAVASRIVVAADLELLEANAEAAVAEKVEKESASAASGA
ncbi:hypothetical protein EXU48_18725 [Occultella glacieicola]|uniref:FHA domain-containing protein n=1 Tax=Occultella glacieicola TaxID=2518684 RepID=A0ABY2DZR3_9MICO|nr:hypothetical protein [Occultella glacieicola]TDE90080.1 hypothetical protein EXU48_18725 [Occultella glacieicola]